MNEFPYSAEGVARMKNFFSKQGSSSSTVHESGTSTSQMKDAACGPDTFEDIPEALLASDIFNNPNVMFTDVTSDLCCTELTLQQQWSAFQHYLYFIYRHVVSVKPYNNGDVIPNIVSRTICEMFDNLLEADTTQVCLNLISLLRDYVLVAKHHIDSIQSSNIATYLVTLMAYYSALCSSAGKSAPLLPEFDFLTLGRFNINWIGINKSIFFHHIYLSPNVQARIPLFIRLHEENNPNLRGLLETYVCFTQDMQALATKWANLEKQITTASKSRARANPKKHLLKDWKMYSEHKKILNYPGWAIRNPKVIKIQDMNELDAHLLAWVSDKTMIPESLIDDKGCCLCEYCLGAEFQNNSMSNALTQSYRCEISANCLIACYICNDPIVLNNLINHIIAQHTRVTSSSEKQKLSDAAKLKESLYEGLLEKNAQIKRSLLQLIDGTASDRNKILREKNKKESSSKLFDASCNLIKSEKLKIKALNTESSANEKHVKNSKEPIRKATIERQIFHSRSEIEALNSNEECKMFFEQMKKLVECNEFENTKTKKQRSDVHSSQVAGSTNGGSKSSPTRLNMKKVKISEEALIESALENESFRKPQQKGIVSNIDSKVLEFLKTANANAQKTASTSPKSSDVCTGHACGHRCRQEEELKRMTCVDSCDHHKDSRKCDCAYCEVFGSAFPPNAPKASETRDRLRTRLNQRKEKGNETGDVAASKPAAPKVQSTTIKSTSNFTTKVSKSTKVPVTTSKTINVTAKVIKTFPTEPPRVPELHHPVPPPGNSKTVHVAVEVKKNEVSSVTTSCTVSTSGTSGSNAKPAEGSARNRSPSSLSTCSLFSESVDCRDINELLNYIEGNKTVDKVAIAHKKAAKKARQRSRKAQEKEEKERIEIEKLKQKEEARIREEKLREEERLKAELAAKQLAERQKKNKKDDKAASLLQAAKKGNKKKNGKVENVKTSSVKVSGGKGSKLIEETIPAMVTIKRASEGNNSQATFTITLKGSNPDTDKLLFTLVNGNDNNGKESVSAPNKAKAKVFVPVNKTAQPSTTKVVTESVKPVKKKKETTPAPKPVKVTIAVDKNNVPKKEANVKKTAKMDTFASLQLQQAFNNNKDAEGTHIKNQSSSKEEIPFPMLNLPPGITITKIDGPPNTGNCKYSHSNNSHHSNSSQNHNINVPSSKSGVIVVDTEKLIQQSIAASISKRDKKMNKKKRDQKVPSEKQPEPPQQLPSEPQTMVTLKNPIFKSHQNNKLPDKTAYDFPSTQQASIFKGENGMVTIRSPRLQNPFETGAPVSSYFSDIQPMFSSDMASSYVPVQQPVFNESNSSNTHNSRFSQYNSHYHAHEFLAGLPGIEITKINKAAAEATENENKKTMKAADVSNVPTNVAVNGLNTFNFDADDWYYENVFQPKESLEEGMNDEELELEEFKRFCHQSIPSAHKEKVTNLNMKDIIFNKKDTSYA